MTREDDRVTRYIGRRFKTDFTVVMAGKTDDGVIYILDINGDRYSISPEELETLIESGLVWEAEPTKEDRYD